MIEVEVSLGRGDREMKTITDDLIRTQDQALMRARQELAKSMTIIKSRTLELLKIEEYSMGEDVMFSNPRLDIVGVHRVSTLAITVSPNMASMRLTVERYGHTP